MEKTSGFIVGIQKGGYTERFVRSKVPANRIAVYDRFQDLFRAALEGEIKVFVATELSLLYYLKENWLINIFEYDRDRPLYSQVYYTATKKGNPALIQQVNDGLNAIGSEERKQLEDKWIVQDFSEIPTESAVALPEKEKMPSKLTAANQDLGKALKHIERVRSGLLSATGEKSVSAKLTSVLVAFNSVASQTKLQIEKISITGRNITIIGNTSSRSNTLKLLKEIKKTMNVQQERLGTKDGRDTFTITAIPKANR